MTGPDRLSASEHLWFTKMGLVFPGSRVVIRGKDLFHELGNMRWMELFLLSITGRTYSENQVQLFEGMWTLCTSYPDPRIWNNRVASLAGTSRSTATLALAAATSVSEATVYGRRPDIRAIDFLIRAKANLASGVVLRDFVITEIKSQRGIAGFARPMVKSDERIDPLLSLARRLNLDGGEHLDILFQVERILKQERYRMNMNIASVGAALAADQGLSSFEYYLFLTPAFTAGILPCFMEALSKEEGTFLPFSCERIVYEGQGARRWDD